MSRPVYCDESIWVPVANGLDRRGWEVIHSRDEGQLGNSDRNQLAYAADRNWLLLTFDDDFLTLVERDGLNHTGIIYVDQAGKRIGDVVKIVDKFLDESDSISREIYFL